MGSSKLQAGLQHRLMHVKEYLACGSPSIHMQGWAGHTLSVDKAELSRRDCQGDHHHQPDSISPGRSQRPPFASCLALTRTWFCTAQPHRKTASIFWEVARKTFLQPTMTVCLLVRQPLLIALLLCGRLGQGNIINWTFFILAVHCLHTRFRRQWVKSTFSRTLPMQLRLPCYSHTTVVWMLTVISLYFLHFRSSENRWSLLQWQRVTAF